MRQIFPMFTILLIWIISHKTPKQYFFVYAAYSPVVTLQNASGYSTLQWKDQSEVFRRRLVGELGPRNLSKFSSMGIYTQCC